MKLITYSQNGGLGVFIPVDETLTVEETAEKNIPQGTPYIITESFDIHDLYDGYLGAYSFDEKIGPVVDVEKYKAIHLDKFRAARAPKLSSLDVAFMRAVEQGDASKQAEIAASKQALRDVTRTPLPDTLPEIKATWPVCLDS
jgi:hypothetical protein